jgi:hypothetical protein
MASGKIGRRMVLQSPAESAAGFEMVTRAERNDLFVELSRNA